MMMTHGQPPDQTKIKPEVKDTVLHARIVIGGTELMGADIQGAQPMRSAYLSLGVDNDADAESMFSALRRRRSIHADAGYVLCHSIRTAAGSVRHQLDDHP